ncbi:hypothetical protein FKM82_000906 [Ascaphus truei]
MAKELSQEEVLDFLCQAGGRVANASLLGHFKLLLRDPLAPAEQQLKRREKFKRYVNSLAVVKQEGAVKYVVLRSRYQDLLGEDLRRPPAPQDLGQPDHEHGYTGPQVGRGWSSSEPGVGQVQGKGGGQWGEVMQSETFGHLQQSTVAPLGGQGGNWEISEAINGEAWGVPSHKETERYSYESISKLHHPSPFNLTPTPSNLAHPTSNLTRSPSSITSSSCPPADSPRLTANNPNLTPSPASSGHWRHPPAGQDIKETANPAFVDATWRDLQEQRQGCMVCTEFQPPSVHLMGRLPQELHSEQEKHRDWVHGELQSDRNYSELSVSPPSSRYIDSAQPPPSLLLPHDSGISQPDVLLADYQAETPNLSPPLPGNDIQGMWLCQIPIFKSIRCQLSLHDLEDFIDQESCESEGSDSGEGGDCDTEHRDEEDICSDSSKKKYSIETKLENSRKYPPNRKHFSRIELYNGQQREDNMGGKDTAFEGGIVSSLGNDSSKSPYTAKSFLTDQAPILFAMAANPPRNRIGTRLQEKMSSSDDELIDRDYRKRRRPSRSKKTPNIPLVAPQLDTDRLITIKPVTSNRFIVDNGLPGQRQVHRLYAPKEEAEPDIKKPFNDRSSAVPLDTMEHDWIVKSASGSWLQVYGLFIKDPQLALRKDFISGYTALHWIAKHGSTEMFQKFVTGAKKAGMELDMDIKSSCGYTPLHLAAIHGHHKVATMLVEKLKVNVKVRDNSGKRAWQYLSCTTTGEVWQLLGAPKGKTIFASRSLNTTYNLSTQNTSSQLNRKASLAAFLKPQHQKWKMNHLPALREREIYSD